jgi:hypothetical protein
MGDERIEQARLAVEGARKILREGRPGASEAWIAAAERHLAWTEARYREAVDKRRPAPDAVDRRT